jgi:hypothetical protein
MAISVGALMYTVNLTNAMLLGEVSPFGEPVGAEEVAVAACRDRAYRFLSREYPSTV